MEEGILTVVYVWTATQEAADEIEAFMMEHVAQMEGVTDVDFGKDD